LAGVQGRLGLVGPDDPHAFARRPLGEQVVTILVLVHVASSPHLPLSTVAGRAGRSGHTG
jgi:hypothetical protein